MSFEVRPIGVIEGPYMDIHSTPIQSRLNPSEVGRIRIFEEFVAGLDGLSGFDFAHVITFLHADEALETEPVDMQPTPLLLSGTGRRIGLFATRFPRRPNPIGLSLVRILSITTDHFEFAGVDMIDGTPVLDIKPWLPAFDVPSGPELGVIRTGWYADVDLTQNRPNR
jgi:tRNA-Thr(GGU) m(6)t(6)A37 methyltransferase TsaA